MSKIIFNFEESPCSPFPFDGDSLDRMFCLFSSTVLPLVVDTLYGQIWVGACNENSPESKGML